MKKILMLLVGVLAAVGFSAKAYDLPSQLYFFDSKAGKSVLFAKDSKDGTDKLIFTIDATEDDVYGAILEGSANSWTEAHGKNAWFGNSNANDEITINGNTTYTDMQRKNSGWDNTNLKFAKGKVYTICMYWYDGGKIKGEITAENGVSDNIDLYLRGEEIGWDANDDHKLTTNDGGKTYTKKNATIPAGGFLICTSGYSPKYGGNQAVTMGENQLVLDCGQNGKASTTLSNVDITFYRNSRKLVITEHEDDNQWYYQVGNGTAQKFTGATPGISVNANDIVYLVFQGKKYSTSASGDVEVSSTNKPSGARVESNYGFKAKEKGTMTITLSGDNVSVGFSKYVAPEAGQFSYCVGTDPNGSYTAINKTVIEGQYNFWTVTLTINQGQNVYFNLGTTRYAYQDGMWGIHGDSYGIDGGSFNKEFKAANGYYQVDKNGTQTYTFMIIQYDGSETYKMACRPVKADTFSSMTSDNNYSKQLAQQTDKVSLNDGTAGELFAVAMEQDYDGKMVSDATEIDGMAPKYNWVKYEHPYWGQTLETMHQGVRGSNNNELTFEDILLWSDTYLHETDPRVLYHFCYDNIEKVRLGHRYFAINRNSNSSHECRNYADAWYRIVITLDDEPAAQGAPARSKRAANTNDPAAGSRVAITLQAPSYADIISGVENVEADADVEMEEAEAEYYTISGIRVYGEPAPGLYIVRKGNKVSKVLVR